MTERKTSDAQMKASRKWQEKNKEHMNYIRKRSAAKGFLKVATEEDLQELETLIAERRYELKKRKKENKMIKVNSIGELEIDFLVEDQEKEIIKMALNNDQEVYRDENGNLVVLSESGDEFPLTTVSKK